MAGTSSRHGTCSTRTRRTRRNPQFEQQQQRDQQRQDASFEALKKRIQEKTNG